MNQNINIFTITDSEFSLIKNKNNEIKLVFAVLLKYFIINFKFPSFIDQVPKDLIKSIAHQLELDINSMSLYSFDGSTFFYHKKQIREFYNIREATNDNISEIENLILNENSLWIPYSYEEVKEKIIFEFKNYKIELPSENRLDRLVNSIFNTLEISFFKTIYNSIDKNNKNKFLNILKVSNEKNNFNFLKSGAGQLNLESIDNELLKLDIINECNFSYDNLNIYPKKVLDKYYKRIKSEDLDKITRRSDYSESVLKE